MVFAIRRSFESKAAGVARKYPARGIGADRIPGTGRGTENLPNPINWDASTDASHYPADAGTTGDVEFAISAESTAFLITVRFATKDIAIAAASSRITMP